MGRGRKKGKKDPLTPAERSKRYREKQLETNPEGYKKRKKKHNRSQYEKKKNNPLTKLQLQMDGIIAYYRKNPLIKVISAKKDCNQSWGVELCGLTIGKEQVTIQPSKKELCLLPELKHKYRILWIYTKTVKQAVKGPSGFLTTKELLKKENQLQMVIAAAKPEKEIISSFKFKISREGSNINWDVCVTYDVDNKCVKFTKGKQTDNLKWKCDKKKKVWNNLKGYHDIVALNVRKNMWYPDYGTIQDYHDVNRLFQNNDEIIVYANPSSGNTEYKNILQDYDEDKEWKDVIQEEHENYVKVEYVPLHGTDKANIPAKYAKLTKPCMCFQVCEIKDHTPLEIVKVHKELNYQCQIEVKWPNYKDLTSIYNHDKIKLMEDFGFQDDEPGKRSTRTKAQKDIYNPAEVDNKLKKFKNEGKKIERENKNTKYRISKSMEVCKLVMNGNDTFGRCMKIFRDCTVTKKVSTTIGSTIWKNLNDHNAIFYQFLRSQFPTAYVDITFDFLFNSITKGIFNLKYKDTQTLSTSWTPVIKSDDKKIKMVSKGKK